DLGTSDGSRLRIDDFDLEFGGGSCRQQHDDESEKMKEPHALLLYTRKGLVLTVRAGLLARESGQYFCPVPATGLPGISQWPIANFLAYSCAAARDFHPLPSWSLLTRMREPKL